MVEQITGLIILVHRLHYLYGLVFHLADQTYQLTLCTGKFLDVSMGTCTMLYRPQV